MKKIIFIVIGIVLLIGAGVLFWLRSQKNGDSGQAVLKVVSAPGSSIFLDNDTIGKTPFEDKVKPGTYTLKLVPESTVGSAVSWESRITLRPNLLTYVYRDLKDNELTSSGEVLTLEKIAGGNAELSVLSMPDAAVVTIDGNEKGVTPLVLRDLNPGNYELSVTQSGFLSRSVKIKITDGFKLTAEFQLASSGQPVVSPSPAVSATPTASPKTGVKVSPQPSSKASPAGSPKASSKPASPPPKPYVEIQETPTGFLRVRATASTSAQEVGRVNPGEFYALLDEDNGWYKIEYKADEEGWVSSQYAKKFE